MTETDLDSILVGQKDRILRKSDYYTIAEILLTACNYEYKARLLKKEAKV